MFKRNICYLVLGSTLTLFYFCSSPNDVSNLDNMNNSDTPLEIGIEKQFYKYHDSLYQTQNVVGKVFREDGQEAFITETFEFMKISDDMTRSHVYNNYHFNSDGYLYSTDIIRKKRKSW